MTDLTPLWKTTTQALAVETLLHCRAVTDALVAQLSPEDLSLPGRSGGWTGKDVLGHIATCERRALVIMGEAARFAEEPRFQTIDEQNAWHVEQRRAWPLAEVQRDYDETRTAVVAAIQAMPDERWYAKVDTGHGRSALALVIAKGLSGGRHGFFAHDLAHRSELA